jgi:hypothetical protein
MKSKPNRNLDAGARNKIFSAKRKKGADASPKERLRRREKWPNC